MGYLEYLKDFVDDATDKVKKYLYGAEGQSSTPGLDYVTDTHPTEDQYRKQQYIGIIFPRYAEYMRNKSQDEYNQKVRDLYDIDYDDITYPWLSHILSNGAEMTAASGGWEFSRNLWKLYK